MIREGWASLEGRWLDVSWRWEAELLNTWSGVCCLPGKQEPEREAPLGWEPGRAGGCQDAVWVQKNCIPGSCEHLPSVQSVCLVPQTLGSGCNSRGHKLLFPKKVDSEICRWVYLMNSLENAYYIFFFWRWNSHNMKFTIIKWTTQWHLVHSPCWATTTTV